MSDLTPEQIKALPCPACLAPAGVSCGEQPHTDRIIAAQAQALTRGRCALCGQPMVHGSLDGAPTDAWHPDPTDAAACPRIPDPATIGRRTPPRPTWASPRATPAPNTSCRTTPSTSPCTAPAPAPSSAPSAPQGSAPTATAPPSTP